MYFLEQLKIPFSMCPNTHKTFSTESQDTSSHPATKHLENATLKSALSFLRKAEINVILATSVLYKNSLRSWVRLPQ